MTEPAQQVKHLNKQIAQFKELTAATDYEAANLLLTQILPEIDKALATARLGQADTVEIEQVIAQFSAYLSTELHVLEKNAHKISAEIRENFSSRLIYSEGTYRKQYGK